MFFLRLNKVTGGNPRGTRRVILSLLTFPVRGNRNKATIFGRALTDSSHTSVISRQRVQRFTHDLRGRAAERGGGISPGPKVLGAPRNFVLGLKYFSTKGKISNEFWYEKLR